MSKAEERLQSLIGTGGIGARDADDLLRDIADILSTLAVERAARERAEGEAAGLRAAAQAYHAALSTTPHNSEQLSARARLADAIDAAPGAASERLRMS